MILGLLLDGALMAEQHVDWRFPHLSLLDAPCAHEQSMAVVHARPSFGVPRDGHAGI